MKIIERGTIPTTQIRCPRCNSVLEIDISDIKYQRIRMVGNDLNINEHVDCPVCDYEIPVSMEIFGSN